MNGCKVAAGSQEAVCVCVCVYVWGGVRGRYREEDWEKRKEGSGRKGEGTGGDLYIATNLTHAFTHAGRVSIDCTALWSWRSCTSEKTSTTTQAFVTVWNSTHMHKTSLHTHRRTCTHRHPLSLTHTHTHSLLCLQKAGTNDRLCVVCAHSAAPWTHFTHPAENSPLCFFLSLLLSMYLSLSCSRCLPTFFSLWRIELFCCALLYILPTVYIFLGPDNRYMSAALFLADTSLSHLPVSGAIKSVHKKWCFDTTMVNIGDAGIYTAPLIWCVKSW